MTSHRSVHRRPLLRARQHGSFAVETALTLTLLFGVGLVGADMYRIGLERTQLEQSAGTAAVTLAMQKQLSAKGLQALSDVLTQGRPQQYQIIVLNVMQSGRINWGFKRGSGGDICTASSQGGRYTGVLPEDPPKRDEQSSRTNNNQDNSKASFIIIQTCRSTDDIRLSSLNMTPVLRTMAVQRAITLVPALDEILLDESKTNGLADT